MEKAKPDYILRLNYGNDIYDRQSDAEHEITTIGIARSSDPEWLFEEFARRFSVLPLRPIQEPKRSVLSIVKAGAGDRDDLAFVLLSLFRWNGFEGEKVELYENSEFVTRAKHVLVYLPAPDRYFDPTSQLTKRLAGSGVRWPEEEPRIHFPYPTGLSAWAFRGNVAQPKK